MDTLAFATLVFGVLGIVLCGQPEVPCAAPRSPEHGQAFIYQEGRVVKYVCLPGFRLLTKEIVRCVDGQWEEPNPTCVEIGADGIQEEPENTDVPLPPARPLFSWGGSEDEQDNNEQEVNSTEGEMPLSDEARIRLLMYPRRRVITTVKTGKIRSATELEEEEKKRAQEGTDGDTSTTIHLGSHPSAVYVRRTVIPGKSETARKALEEQYGAASLHMTVDNGDDVQLISLPRAAVSPGEKGQQADEAMRQLYWYNYLYNYPRYASLVNYHSGTPVVMTLTESQLAWINSLHPELRDQYLKDLYGMRAGETVEGERAQAFLQRYEDAYNYYYHHIPYLRRPMSLVVEDPIASYDYTCHESGHPFIKAPRLRNMHVQRYDRRQNPNNPHNNYLSAVYRCNPGYIMLDTRFTELHCSKKDWIGVKPVCVRRG